MNTDNMTISGGQGTASQIGKCRVVLTHVHRHNRTSRGWGDNGKRTMQTDNANGQCKR